MKRITATTLLCLAFHLFTCPQKTPCEERNNWKFEDFTQRPLFANQIFVKGYGIYFLYQSKKQVGKDFKDSIENVVLNGFRTALTNWGVSLIINRDSLSSEIKSYLNDYSIKTGGNSTYNAPMVFKVDCAENANFVFQIYFKYGNKFKDNTAVLAKAQIKGRTIILNMQNHILLYEQRFFDVRHEDGSFNIVPILAHELGHCFGLLHSTDGLSVMASTAKSMARFPTTSDGLQFARILAVKLKGTAPGYFNPTDCAGLVDN